VSEEKHSSQNYNTGFIIGAVILAIVLVLISFSTIGVAYVTNLPIEENGGVAVNVQDQTTPPFAIRINQIESQDYSISSTPEINTYNITINSSTGLSIGDKLAVIEQNGEARLFFGEILNIIGNVLIMDSLIPFNFTTAATVFKFNDELIIDGATNEQVYSIFNFFDAPVDITRVIFHCTDNVQMHDGLFCGQSELNRGILFRKKKIDGSYINYWNIKNNGEWRDLAYDVAYSGAGKPPDSTYGLGARLTYGGQSKHGVVIRLEKFESIELVIQDDLTDISTAHFMVEGHFTQD